MELEYNADEKKLVNKDGFTGIREKVSQIFTIESNIQVDLQAMTLKRREVSDMIEQLEKLDRQIISPATDQKMSILLKKIVRNWKSIESHLNHVKKMVTGVF